MNLQLAKYTALLKTVWFVAAGWLFRFYKGAMLVLLFNVNSTFEISPISYQKEKKGKLYFTNLTNFPGNSVHFSKSEWTLDGLFSQLGSSLPCTRSALNGLWTWIRKCILLFWKMKKKSNWFNRIFLFLYLSNATIGKVLQSLNQHLFCITFFDA